MLALAYYIAGILIIHGFWALSYLCGTLVWTPRVAGSPGSLTRGTPGALLEIVVASATGMAIFGLASFVIGMAGLLYPVTAAAFVALVGVLFVLLGDSPLRPAFWTVRYQYVAAACTPAALTLYACTLIAAVPAIFPETAFDAVFYHLVYGLDWAHAHRIYVDQAVRFPYYAHNWILLDTWMFELGLNRFIDFLGWLSGALSALAAYGIVDALAPHIGRRGRYTVPAAALLAGLAVLAAPNFERYLDTGMVDVPIGFYFIVSVAAVVMAVASRERRWAFYTMVCFGFFVGTKGSFLAFLPVAVIATWIACRACRMGRRSAVALCVVAFCLSVPWYAKNFVQAGDPIAPYLNLALHHPDSKWTANDMAGVMADLKVDQSPAFLALLPIDIVLNPTTRDYREPGVSLMMLFVFLPGVVLAYVLLKRGPALTGLWSVYSALLFYAVTYWLVTTHLGRYELLFFPALCAFIALLAVKVAAGPSLRRVAALAVLTFAALPAPVGAAWLSSFVQTEIIDVPDTFTGRNAYLNAVLPAYPEEERISGELDRSNLTDPRVYVIGDYQLAYYFKQHDVTYLGDWFGPERFIDFATAIDRGAAASYLKSLRIDAVLLSPHPLFAADRVSKLEKELAAAGYREDRLPGQPSIMFLAPGVAR